MVLLVQVEKNRKQDLQVDLHSTMVLLVLEYLHPDLSFLLYLHSTMVLLVRGYVVTVSETIWNLHSTMVLLVPTVYHASRQESSGFTFHYGAIST